MAEDEELSLGEQYMLYTEERERGGKLIATNEVSDGSTANYYQLPAGCTELQDLISFKAMNAQIGEIFRESYRYGQAAHSDKLRGIRKILFYADAELKRLQNYGTD